MPAFATELMPDNMGFPVPGEGTNCTVKGEALGLKEHTCAICGKRFEVSNEYRYKIVKKNTARWYCCYKHFRLEEEKECARFKKLMLGRWAGDYEDRNTPEQLLEKEIAKCRKHLAQWQARFDDREAFAKLTIKKRGEINRQIVAWHTRLIVAEQKLEELKSNAKSKDIR